MEHAVIGFKSLEVALKELEPFVKDGRHLQTGRDVAPIGLRSREILANWLTCAAVNATTTPNTLVFASSSRELGGDGVIVHRASGTAIVTEHVSVPHLPGDRSDIGSLILSAINQKRTKGGEAYARGKTLIVFLLQPGDPWNPTQLTRALPEPLQFEAVWVVGLHGAQDGGYAYDVTRLDVTLGRAPVWRVAIAPTFDSWRVHAIQ